MARGAPRRRTVVTIPTVTPPKTPMTHRIGDAIKMQIAPSRASADAAASMSTTDTSGMSGQYTQGRRRFGGASAAVSTPRAYGTRNRNAIETPVNV
jgi:hypothetical protein